MNRKNFVLVTLSLVLMAGGRITAQQVTELQPPPAEEEVAVTVNGVGVPEAQVQQMLQAQLRQLQAQQQQLPEGFLQQYQSQLRQQILEQLIAQELLTQKAAEEGIEAERDDALEYLEQLGSRQQPPMGLDDIRQSITAQGQDFDKLIDELTSQLGPQKLLEQQFEGKVEVSSADAKQFYDENQQEFTTPGQVRARHILIDSKQPDAAEQAARLRAEIVDQDADFAAVAKEHSACPSSQRGGDLGFFGRGQMVPEFDKEAFELEEGAVSEVVETQFGHHIIKVEQRRAETVEAFDQAQTRIQEMLKQQKQMEIAEAYIAKLREEAEIAFPQGQAPQPQAPPAEVSPF